MESLQQIPLGELKLSPFDVRTSVDDAKLAELAASFESGGIHEPLIGRRVNGKVEVVAGGRRLRAAKKAGLTTVPVIVKDLTDTQAMELQIIENEQREDVSALDQAAGFQKLMKMDPKTYTVEHLAQRVGLQPASVYLRLKLLRMITPAQELMREGLIEAGQGVLIARLGEADQTAVVKWMKDEAKYHDGQYPAVRDLKRHIKEHIKIDLLSPTVAEEQPEVAKKLTDLRAKGVKPVLVTRNWTNDKGILGGSQWREVGKKKCDHVQVAANAFADQVELLDVCTNQKCKVHFPEAAAQRRQTSATARAAKETPAAKEKRLKAERAAKAKRALEDATRGAVLLDILATVKAVTKPILAYLVTRELDASGSAEFSQELQALGLTAFTKSMGESKAVAALAKATDRQLAQLAVFAAIAERLTYELPKVAKEFGVNLKAIERKVQTAAKQTAKAEGKVAKPIDWKTHFSDEKGSKSKGSKKKGKKAVH